jgi:hypothetical protein
MSLSPKQIGIIAGSGISALLTGALITNGIKNNAGLTIALSTLLTLPTAVGIHLVVDTQATKRINQAEGKAKKAESKASQAEYESIENFEKWQLTRMQLEQVEARNSQLSAELATIQQALEQAEGDRAKFASMIGSLQPTISKLESELAASREQVEELQLEVEAWEQAFDERVNQEATERFQQARRNEIQRIFQEHDVITGEAMTLFNRLQQWAVKIADSHESKRSLITSLDQSYNGNLDQINAAVDRERQEYLTQIELLHEKVGRLQHALNGDLVEPEYLAVAYSVEGRIANDIAREVFTSLQIPLAVKGYHTKPDGSTDVALGYSRLMGSTALIEALKRQLEAIARELRIHKITSIRKLEIADLLVLNFRREPSVKEDTIRLIAGTPDQFLEYVASHPIRYRLIADPGTGKTPITAVMVSEILKVGGTRGNTGKGRKIPNTLVTVSCPDVESSQKDADYPLEIFLKYGNTTAAVKSFSDADEDWKYRKCDTNYAQSFFQLWVWDELDNTLNNADDPKAVGEKFKNFLKQAHHTGVGWIVSGQSVMTKQIPGFMDDDRELFTQVIIGTSKIRKYLEKYGKKILSAKVVNQLLNNLDDLEPYIEDKNSLVTDAARLLRLALVLDDKSPKLYFLPNLDSAKFNAQKIEETTNKAQLAKRSFLAGTSGSGLESINSTPDSVSTGINLTVPSNPTLGGESQSGQKPHCPHCGAGNLNLLNDGRYRCLDCKKRFVTSKIVWK